MSHLSPSARSRLAQEKLRIRQYEEDRLRKYEEERILDDDVPPLDFRSLGFATDDVARQRYFDEGYEYSELT